jgi:hypothetical protein
VSIKTDRLAALFPDIYASREGASLLHRLLDAIGAENVHADTAVKVLLKSHWVDYATGGGLDGLGALLGVSRRLLADGTPEDDGTFRPLLKSTVPSYIGGGTVEAIKGAVRAALGLPYDLDLFQKQLAGPGGSASNKLLELVAGLRTLVQIEEFSPKAEVILGHAAPTATGSTTTLEANFTTIQPAPPRIEWTFNQGGGRHLSLLRQDSGAGIVSTGEFEVPDQSTLLLAGKGVAGFSASIGTRDVTSWFKDIDGVSPPQLPEVPTGDSRWIFSAKVSAEFDVSSYDRGQSFDAAGFSVRMAWIREQPLTFDVIVPYFVEAAIRRILGGTGYETRFKVFKGLSLDAIQKVVDRSRAAGVRGMVQYSLALPGESTEKNPWEDQAATEAFSGLIEDRSSETNDTVEGLTVGALEHSLEMHDAFEHFAIGGVFNVSVFDGSFGFQ